MSTNVHELREEVQRCVDAAMACAEPVGATTLAAVERELWQRLLALGCALVALFLARAAGQPRAASYSHAGRTYLLRGERRSRLGTLFGKVTFVRPTGRGVGGRSASVDDPVGRELAIRSGFSLPTVLAVGRLCAQMAFATARDTFQQTHRWAPSPRAVLRIVDGLGQRARSFLEQAPPPDGDGEILVVQMDGKGAPMIGPVEYERRCAPRRHRSEGTERKERRSRRREHPRVRRTSGKKSKNAKVAVVGVLYTLRRTRRGVEGPVNKQLVATFESHDALARLLRREADKRGYGRKRTIFLGDGSEHIWRVQARYFPDAECCIDWYHIVEKVWEAGQCLHEAGSEPLKRWVEAQKARLHQSRVGEVVGELQAHLSAIPKTGPGNKWRRELLARTIKHFSEHAHRMPYRRFRAEDLDIGSGAVEGAVRNLVGVRFDGPGMRWGRERSEALLQLRCILLNRQWPAFMQWMAEGEPLRLAAQPIPSTPYAAKAAA